METLSVCMATYNGGKFIRQQLDSLAKQTVLPDELVITDDNSTDDTLAIVADFAAGAPFPVHVEKNGKQLGYRANFMKAASLCKGDLISFCDQDDVWLPQKLEKCRAAFANEDVLLVYHNAMVVDENLHPKGLMDRLAAPQFLNPPQSLDPMWFGLGFTLVFRRNLLTFPICGRIPSTPSNRMNRKGTIHGFSFWLHRWERWPILMNPWCFTGGTIKRRPCGGKRGAFFTN